MVLVSDFDGTLFDKNYKNNIKAINDFVRRGNIFVIATGRNIKELKEDLDEELNFSYLICNDGGMIFDKEFNLIFRNDIKDEFIPYIFNALKESVCVGNPVIDLGYAYMYEISKNANCIMAKIIDRNRAQELSKALLKKYKNITSYVTSNSIYFAGKSVNKGNAIKYVGKLTKVKPRKMYVVGDNINDIEMCKIGYGIAMENSNKELLKVCKKTTKSIEELVNNL